jgi:hypothetical protein
VIGLTIDRCAGSGVAIVCDRVGYLLFFCVDSRASILVAAGFFGFAAVDNKNVGLTIAC